ncbi:MAG: acetylornithine deacetylase [Candidatus Nephthysia bennettiae]|uniref:Probable succinyl-diaminopimelate desuccinylase n=1 Tax=Candidatus Nephthysia bennettiae TaxID=3127016 RepID=A0A934N8N1_9BACT|nr:M20 family metallopeptidase [Candidatus Dormibacteraeota bacterium]MBJ7612642.1 M20 family metallopeptidase [Candidatus Dormibacteraeota bacterium]PZR97421.1 MAG: acetylornithine deacetylase [Candidatus Dormibacteraeota bacterium]
MGGIDAKGLVAFAQALVRIPSVNRLSDGLGEGPAAALVAEQMRRFGWHPLIEESAPERPNVIAVVDGGAPGPTLMFEGHTDVVTEGDRAAWSQDPFGGEIVDGRLYGRGAADMKGGLAAMLFAAAALAAEGPFPGRLLLAALADEEGLMLGVKDFVARGHAAGVAAVVVCEPEGGEVCVAQKGALRLGVEARGRMAHGAMPDQGLNPIPRLAAFAASCPQLQDELQGLSGRHELLGLPYITPTVIRAGSPDQLNVIPEQAWLGLDVRTTPAVDHDQLVRRLRAACGEGLTLSVIEDRPSTETPADHPVVQAVAEAHRRVHGSTPRLGGVPGATDGTILFRDAGLPIVTYGPGGKWIAHQVDEYVEVEELVQAAEVYQEAARLFFSLGTASSRARV